MEHTSLPVCPLILHFIAEFKSFRFKTGTPEIQSMCIKYLKSYFINHPELRSDLEGENFSGYFRVEMSGMNE